MNKIKILLSAIIIIAIVGAVFAFKAKKGIVSICSIMPIDATCPLGRKCLGSIKAMVTTIGIDKACINQQLTADCKKLNCEVLKSILYEE